MKAVRGTRKALLVSGVILMALAGVVGSFPFWASFAIRPAARHFGLAYSNYERVGYKRFALTNVRYKTAALDLKADRIEGFLPGPWLWNARKSNQTNLPAFIEINQWQLKVSESPSAPSTAAGESSASIDDALRRGGSLLQLLRIRIPKAALSNGSVFFKDHVISCPALLWQDGVLEGELKSAPSGAAISLSGNFQKRETAEISAQMDALDFRSRVWITVGTEGSTIRATNSWQQSDLELDARFGRKGLWPEEAKLISKSFRLPADWLKTQRYRDLTGSLNLDWKTNRFSADILAAAPPIDSSNIFRPLVQAQVHATGTRELVTLSVLKVSAPGVNLELSQPAEMDFKGDLRSSRAEFRITADLSQLPGLTATGEIAGAISLIPVANRFPRADFSVMGTNLSAPKLPVSQASLAGALDWPNVNVTAFEWRESTNSTATLSGTLNLENKVLSQGKIGIEGALGRGFLPPGYFFEHLSLAGEASGPLTNVLHSGRIEIRQLATPKTPVLRVQSEWKGRQINIDQFGARISAGPASLDIRAAVRTQEGQTNVSVENLRLQKGEETLLELARPFAITFQPPSLSTNKLARIQVGEVQWRGSDRSLNLSADFEWPRRALIQVSAQRFDLAVFQPFLTNELEGAFFENLKLEGGWTNGPVFAQLESVLHFSLTPQDPFVADFKLRATDRGTAIDHLGVSGNSGEIITAKGALPLILNPAAGPSGAWKFDQDNPIQLQVATATNELFWNRISEVLGVKLGSPRISATVSGTPRAPQGRLDLSVAEIQYTKSKKPAPKIRELEAAVQLNEKSASLTRLTFLLDAQPMSISGELPLGEEFWKDSPIDLKKHLWEKANLRLSATNFALAPFVPYFPLALAPQGTAQIDLALTPGGNLQGTINLEGVTTRPFAPVGVLENIRAALKLTNRVIRISEFAGSLGGEPMSASGYVDLSDEALQTGMPLFELKLKGKDLPLVRQPELILRSDLDISLTHTNTGEPIISGVMNLRDSFFLSDIRTMIPGRIARPDKRPPYFSIETEPFAGWRLDVRARGDNFFHIKSPLFTGEVSANFRIEGSLKEPFASGEGTINSGLVQFPFANVKITQGLVSLTRDTPYRPQVLVNGASRAFGYDLKMSIHGPADEPVIDFSSTPSLSAQQIILMLTAGEMPHNEINFSNQQRAGALAMFLGKSLWSKLSSGEGGAERLSVTSGEDVSETGKQTYSIEYKLTDRWSIVGEYDRYSALNAGLKWKIYSR